MKQLQMVTHGLPPFHSANTSGTFPYKGLGAQLTPVGSLRSRSTQSSGGRGQMGTKFYGSPREEELGPPWMVKEGVFYASEAIAYFPQHTRVAGTTQGLEGHLPEAATPDHEAWGRKFAKKQLEEGEEQSA